MAIVTARPVATGLPEAYILLNQAVGRLPLVFPETYILLNQAVGNDLLET